MSGVMALLIGLAMLFSVVAALVVAAMTAAALLRRGKGRDKSGDPPSSC